jgi:hypothetical protein
MMGSSLIEMLLAFIGLVRHRTDQMITTVLEVFFVLRSRLGGDRRHIRNSEAGNTTQPRMRGVTG